MERRRGWIARTLDAVQGRFRRARPGSVLIMVVSLLVLLALIGTAAMSTSRLDRVSSLQHVRNTQIDILATSVKEMVVALLSRDLSNGTGGINPWDSAISPPASESIGVDARDAILGSRIPERMMRVLHDIPSAGPNVREDPMNHNAQNGRDVQTPAQDAYVWTSPSYPPVQNGQNNSFKLELPNEPTDDPSVASANFYQLLVPKPRFQPSTIQVNGQTYPALLAFDELGNPKESLQATDASGNVINVPLRIGGGTKPGGGGKTGPFLAADADGDGIADSILFRLPMAPVTGITYFGAIRVVDNAAAINVNTAWTADQDVAQVMTKGVPSAATPQPWVAGAISLAGVHTGGVDLRSLLDPTRTPDPATGEPALTEMQQVSGQRLFGQRAKGLTTTPDYPNTPPNPLYQPAGPPGPASTSTGATIMDPISEEFWNPYDATNNPGPNYKFHDMIARTDYLFVTPNDAMDKQLGRRLDYPGPWAPHSTGARPDVREDWDFWGNGVRPFGVGDAIALAYRFTVLNPDAHDSTIERALFRSAVINISTYHSGKYVPAGSAAQAKGEVDNWFIRNFDFPWVVVPNGAAPTPLRTGYNEGAAAGANYPSEPLPLRALLTTLNPVRNTVDAKEFVTADPSYFAPIQMLNTNGLGSPSNPKPFWDQEIFDPTNDSRIQEVLRIPAAPTTKVNINTAPFGDLWRAFMNVMSDAARVTPFDFGRTIDGDYDPIYRGNRFGPAPTFASVTNEEHIDRMFRSPLRPVGVESAAGAEDIVNVSRMHPYQVMLLRSAIAAVNTEALRNDLDVRDPLATGRFMIKDRIIPYADILLPQVDPNHDPAIATPTAPYTTAFYAGLGATVYGVKRQPFITEVLLSNNVEQVNGSAGPQQNQSGFAAIEIHNPYDRPMDVSGWKLSVIDRRPVTGTTDPSDPEQRPGGTRVQWAKTAAVNQPVLRMVDLPSNTYATTPRWDPTVGTPQGDGTNADDSDPDGSASQRFRFPPDTIIPPGGHLVVTNTPIDPSTVAALDANDLDTARYAPAGIDMTTMYARAVNKAPRTATNRDLIYTQGGLALAYSRYLHFAIGHEVVLSRPIIAYEDAGPSMAQQIQHKLRWMPVDSFDSTGLKHQIFDPTNAVTVTMRFPFTRMWHYARASDPAAGRAWHFVYPGRYDASKFYNPATPADDRMHHQGTESVGWASEADLQNPDPWSAAGAAPAPGITMGALNTRNTRDNNVLYPTVSSTFPIQIANTDFTAHFDDSRLAMANNPTGGFPTNPMHGFLHNGDIQQVTYIGSYTIWDAGDWKYDPKTPAQQAGRNDLPQPPYAYDPNGGFTAARQNFSHNPTFIEVNSLPMDAAFAEDTDGGDDRNPWDDGVAGVAPRPLEDVGRFAPLNVARRDAGHFVGDLQAESYAGVTSGADLADGKTNFYETEPLGGRSLRTLYPNDFWNGYEVVITNNQPAPGETWRVQRQYVKSVGGFVKNSGGHAQITLANPLPFNLDTSGGRTYTFRLQCVRYGWAAKLHEYFTTSRSPVDDYSPNVDPDPFLVRSWGRVLQFDPVAHVPYPLTSLYAVKNVRDPNHAVNRPASVPAGAATTLPEDDVPSEGLININTASWRVLAQLPLVMREDDPTRVDHYATEYLARQIVYFRDIDDGRGYDPNDTGYADPTTRIFKPRPHGPFKNIFELLLIPEFEACRTPAASNPYLAPPNPTAPPRNLLPTQNPNRDGFIERKDYDPSVNDGDFSPLTDPASPRGDGVRWDWKEKYLMLNRIANLITTKSDCYTAYIQVQGWRDAGTPDATLVSQKRLAFIVDRSRVTSTGNKRTPTVYNVPVAE